MNVVYRSLAVAAAMLTAACAEGQTPIAALTVPNLSSDAILGFSVATDGQRVLVGTRRGQAYLFDPFTETLLTTFNVGGFDTSVAIEGATAVVGADRGNARIYDLTNLANIGTKTLAFSDASVNRFGLDVDLSGDVVIVGLPRADAPGLDSPGAAYLFNRTTGAQYARLGASDAMSMNGFGFSVAVDGPLAIVGAPGAFEGSVRRGTAYLFNVDPTFAGNRQVDKFVPPPQLGGLLEFGIAVDISGESMVAQQSRDGAFLWNTSSEPALLPESNAIRFFTNGVSVSGDFAVAGYHFEHRAEVYRKDGKPHAYITSPVPTPTDFGLSVAIGGGLVVVGSPGNDTAYVYRLQDLAVPEPSGLGLAVGATSLLLANGRRRWPQ